MKILPFQSSQPFTIGVELELQVINKNTYNLTNKADFILDKSHFLQKPWCLKPELTNNNLEINSSVHQSVLSLQKELFEIRDFLKSNLTQTNIAVCGGGCHPFQDWKNSEIYPSPHNKQIEEAYGYLAKHDTIFGLHIHIGCQSGDEAIYLTHMLSSYIPHLIAFSGSSPFIREVDTLFTSARLTNSSSFPTTGVMPFLKNWEEFSKYFHNLIKHKIISSIHNIYWDIRPQGNLGTVELRICDMPLSISKISEIVAYTQALAKYLLEEQKPLNDNLYHYYMHNRFQSMRFGYDGSYVDSFTEQDYSLQEHMLLTLENISDYFDQETSLRNNIKQNIENKYNHSQLLRQQFQEHKSYIEIVKKQISQWEQDAPG